MDQHLANLVQPQIDVHSLQHRVNHYYWQIPYLQTGPLAKIYS